MRKSDPTDPRWQPKTGSEMASDGASADDDGPKPDTRKVLYMYGPLQSVICTSDVAVLKIRSGQKVINLRTDNYKKLLVMGADEFSCDWRDKKVLVNYKQGGKSDGDLVTLELQAGK